MPSHPERRRKERVRLSRGLIARFGSMGAIIVDITDAGARIEHFNPLDVRKKAMFRFDWQHKSIETTAEVISSKVDRFAPGEEGTTVYQSGLQFSDHVGDSADRLRDLTSNVVDHSLAEQVANASGIGPVAETDMPVFRGGVVAANGDMSVDRGYLRCTLISGVRFEKKWSRTPDQPREGFTVPASEPPEHVDQLCETYLKGSEDDRKLILLLAKLSVAKT